MELKIEVACNHKEVVSFLEEKVYEHNCVFTQKCNGEHFTLVVHSACGDIIAGITGWVWASVSEITYLWVAVQYRAIGLGRKLLEFAECEVLKRGGKSILVRSYSFQAPAFYERYGYRTVFVLDNFPDGFRQYNLLKSLCRD